MKWNSKTVAFGCLLVILLFLVVPGGAAESAPITTIAYLDVHSHLFPTYRRGGGGTDNDYAGSVQVLAAAMEKLGAKMIFLLPQPFTVGQETRYDIEDFQRLLAKYPGRFAVLGGGGSLNVILHQAVQAKEVSPALRERFEKRALEIVNSGALGFGEMAAEHFSFEAMHPYESAPPDHPLLLLLADIAAKYNMPIDLHMEALPQDQPFPSALREYAETNPEQLRGNIAGLDRLLAHNRQAKIIWDHIGWDNTGLRTIELTRRLMQAHSNLYVSVKMNEQKPNSNRLLDKDLKLDPAWLALMKEFPDRFLIGSDQFYPSPLAESFKPERMKLAKLFISQLPPELAQQIGVENVYRVFGRLRK